MTYSLALKTIAANDDRLVPFEAGNMEGLRQRLFALAPDFDFHIYYYHAPVGEYFRLYDGIDRRHMIFRRTELSREIMNRAWSGILMMAGVEARAVKRLAGRPMTSAIARHYPKIPATLHIIHR